MPASLMVRAAEISLNMPSSRAAPLQGPRECHDEKPEAEAVHEGPVGIRAERTCPTIAKSVADDVPYRLVRTSQSSGKKT